MNEIKIYVKGTAGFKPAVKAKLADVSEYKIRNINVDNIMVLMGAGSQIKDLKMTIGEDLATLYGLQFLASLDAHQALKSSKWQRSELPVNMSVWTSEHSNIRAMKMQLLQHDPGAPVF
jgi:hypothetical protein